MLGALARYVDYHNNQMKISKTMIFKGRATDVAGVMFLVSSMNSAVRERLIGNNFLSHFSSGTLEGYPTGGYLGYREHNYLLDADKIADHLQNEWLSAAKLRLSEKLKPAITSRILEIFSNAYGHGVSIQDMKTMGVYSCGQFNKKEKSLNISVLDFGPGIIKNVRRVCGEVSSIDAMRWALIKGNSTRTDSQLSDIPRGLGLDLLHNFVYVNGGELRIYSNDVKVIYNKASGLKVERNEATLHGTMVSIKINCDDRYYRFTSETEPKQHQYF
ncbi:ATP-binding protein [Stutzerimonas stutzeri]|nr:ATP-binding protein [Stutzerimonas stutzeri]